MTRFTGQIRDNETGNDFFNARYYTSSYGRFMSPDPANAGADITNPQSWNAYAYVLGNPLALVDPSGRSLHDIWGSGNVALHAWLSLAVVAAFAAGLTALAVRTFSRSAVS